MKQNLTHFYNCISKVGLKYSCYSKYFLEILDTHVKIASISRLEKHSLDLIISTLMVVHVILKLFTY